jgi:mannose-6-phosphate isomerase-like protein (cupin superfamily)
MSRIHRSLKAKHIAILLSSRASNTRNFMPTIIDLTAELAETTMLRERTPHMTRAERQGSSRNLAGYRDGAIFASKFAGSGGWERHRNGDELVHIIDGATTLHLLTEDGSEALALHAGMMAIVPQGVWHRFDAPLGVTLMTVTPQPTDHPPVHVDDPRTLEAQPA